MTENKDAEKIYVGVDMGGSEDEPCAIMQSLKELMEYRAIGTIEEIKDLKEKSVAKKPKFYAHNYYCTECGNLVGNNEFEWQRFLYCDKCGQKLDWQRKEKNVADEAKENNKQLVCEIKIDAEMMRKIIDEKMTQIELDIQGIRAKAIDEFVNTLIPRLTDAIYQKDVESMSNLINDVARELKAGEENEID